MCVINMFRKAVVIIHGFAGGTYDQEYLANYLELDKFFDVFTFTLPGHDLVNSNVTKENWVGKCESYIKMLIKHKYKNIYLIGHSMGGVIASFLATKYKEVKKLVLLAPAFKYLALDSNDNFSWVEGIKKSSNIIKEYGSEEIISRILKLPFKTVSEFVSLVKQYENVPKQIKVPTLFIHGLNDNIVPIESSNYAYNLIPIQKKEIVFLENVNHDIFRSNKRKEICEIIKKFLK